jgi:lysophospholipase L1-like esterase
MLGTNDSAIQGPHGAPISATNYRLNLKWIIDSLLLNYPRSKIIINYPLWYSPNTHNHSAYLQAGLSRLQTYFPEIDTLVNTYSTTQTGHVFIGNKTVFNYFKKHYLSNLKAETGQDGVFYLHPNEKGVAVLGEFWGKSINRVLNK